MERHSLDCLVLFPGANFSYFTGLKFVRERYRLLAALVPRDGCLTIMGPSFEEEKMKSGPTGARVLTWTDEENQYRRVAREVERACGPQARLGLDSTANHYHRAALGAELAQAAFVDATAAVERLRAIKSAAEVDCLRRAASITRARMDRVPLQLREGMSEAELAGLMGAGAMVQFGTTTSLPNEAGGNRRLRRGNAVVIDAGDRVEGYRSDLTRTFFWGNPSKKMREVYKVVRDAELAGIEAAAPGNPAGAIDRAAREVIRKAGYGEFFTHRGGHGIGLDFHELPICHRDNAETLEPGMVVAVEPGVYIPGKFGVRLEDDIAITATGRELISQPGPWASWCGAS